MRFLYDEARFPLEFIWGAVPPHRHEKSPAVGSTTMLDILLLALGLAFFALSVGYAYACERP